MGMWKVSFINDNLIKLFKYLSNGCDVSILIKILSERMLKKIINMWWIEFSKWVRKQ